MKTYDQYLKIIKNREDKEHALKHKSLGRPLCQENDFCSIVNNKFTMDYSVEIMGMMMQDFLEELPFNAGVPQVDKHGVLKVKVVKE